MNFRDTDERRVDPEERKTHDIKAMWQRHHEIVNLAAQGFKQVEIAEILNIDPQTVSNTLNSTLGKEKLSELREIRDGEAKKNVEKIRILKDKAIQVYHKIFDNPDGQATLKDQKEVATTVLMELSGLREPTKIQSHHTSIALTTEELTAFKQRGIQASKEAGLVIDVTPEDDTKIVSTEES
jgi:DNA-binding CsgD family transcriptional regulator